MERTARRAAMRPGLSFTKKDAAMLSIAVMGFFIGRFVVLESLNPVAVGFSANFLGAASLYLIAPFTLAGIATLAQGNFILKYAISFGLILACNAVIMYRRVAPNIYVRSFIAAGCILAGGLFMAALEGFSPYFATLAVLEASMALFITYILKKGVSIVAGKKSRKILGGEEAASVAILSGAIIAGMVDIYVGDVALRLFVASFAILVAAYKGGVTLGATVAMVIGLLLYIANYQSASLTLIMAFGGFCAGLFRKRGKVFSLAGFVLGGLIVAGYINPAYLTRMLLFSSISGGLVFLITPDKFYFNVNSTLNPISDNSDEYLRRMQSLATERLNAFAAAFAKLSGSFSRLSEKRTSLGHKEITMLIDDICAKACDSCSMKEFCWQANFYDTYQYLFSMLGTCEAKGKLELRDLPEAFRDTCINQLRFIDTVNRLFELHKLNLAWSNKVIDSRELVSQQLNGVSNLVQKLSRDLGLELRFREDLEEAIIRELGFSRVEAERVIVLENKQGRFEISLSHKPCQGPKQCRKEISAIISRVVGRRMTPGECAVRKGLCQLNLREEQRYRLTTGLARSTKNYSSESGDSYSFLHLRNAGHALLALSDGMGSGRQASSESTTTIELLEDLLESGFDTGMAVKMINSALVMKTSEESFSTLDLCSINLYSGEAEFCKIGAASTFLLRGSGVRSIRSASLPMGILNNVDLEIFSRQLKPGDIIVMLTDGIFSQDSPHGEWIAESLPRFAGRNPQTIADDILEEAQRRTDHTINDDMTVLVARMMER